MNSTKKKKRSIFLALIFIAFITASLVLMLLDPGKQNLKREFSYEDICLPANVPPGGLAVKDVPQFVVFGFDDNAYSGLEGSDGDGGMLWALNFLNSQKNPAGNGNQKTFDGTPITSSFYLSTIYAEKWMSEDPKLVTEMWRRAWNTGHEVGLHSHNHAPNGNTFSPAKWNEEINTCLAWLSGSSGSDYISIPVQNVGIPGHLIVGWRSPHLLFNNSLFDTLKNNKILYDCSIEEGWQKDADGKTLIWPYTLDKGSPGNIRNRIMKNQDLVTSHTGLWELPVYPVFVPPDEKCSEYGIKSGFRAQIKKQDPFFDVKDVKLVGFDYNLWVSKHLTAAEFLAILKYTLDLRLEGNRAPFTFGAHTDYYSSKYKGVYFTGAEEEGIALNATYKERQKAIEDFIKYALSKPQVRIVSNIKLLEWMQHPESL